MNWIPAPPVSDTTVPTYANGVEILFSQWDFTFNMFHLFGMTAPEPTVGNQLVARVVMSPQHTKAMLLVLQQNISGYEERFGAIPEFPLGPPPETEKQS